MWMNLISIILSKRNQIQKRIFCIFHLHKIQKLAKVICVLEIRIAIIFGWSFMC